MEFEFADHNLEDVYYNTRASIGHGAMIDKGFRKVMNKIRAAHTELDLRNLKGLHYHQLDGKRSHQHALDITDQWRLIVKRIENDRRITLLIIEVEDYH